MRRAFILILSILFGALYAMAQPPLYLPFPTVAEAEARSQGKWPVARLSDGGAVLVIDNFPGKERALKDGLFTIREIGRFLTAEQLGASLR